MKVQSKTIKGLVAPTQSTQDYTNPSTTKYTNNDVIWGATQDIKEKEGEEDNKWISDEENEKDESEVHFKSVTKHFCWWCLEWCWYYMSEVLAEVPSKQNVLSG